MSDADLEAMFDEVAEESAAPDTAKPKPQRKKSAQPKGGKKKPRAVRSPAEKSHADPEAVRKEKASKLAKDLGVNLSSAGLNALDGLVDLFGGPNRLNSGLSFDDETYAKAKPHFIAALRDLEAAGKNVRDLIRVLVNNFGTA